MHLQFHPCTACFKLSFFFFFWLQCPSHDVKHVIFNRFQAYTLIMQAIDNKPTKTTPFAVDSHTLFERLLQQQASNFFFFFRQSFNLWRSFLMITLYHQTKTLISFWCKRRLNHRSLIQPSEILPVKLPETHQQANNLN